MVLPSRARGGALEAPPSGGTLQVETTCYDTAGTVTVTRPAWATRCYVELYGAGGDGGDNGGQGGAAGEYVSALLAISAATVEVQVGTPGPDKALARSELRVAAVAVARAAHGLDGADTIDATNVLVADAGGLPGGGKWTAAGYSLEMIAVSNGPQPGGGGGYDPDSGGVIEEGAAGYTWVGGTVLLPTGGAGLSRTTSERGGGGGGAANASGNGYAGGVPGGGGGAGGPGATGGSGGRGRVWMTWIGV